MAVFGVLILLFFAFLKRFFVCVKICPHLGAGDGVKNAGLKTGHQETRAFKKWPLANLSLQNGPLQVASERA